MRRFGSNTAASSIEPGTDPSQVKTTAADIAAAGVAAPLALWNLDAAVTESITGGAGRDLANGNDEVPSWELIQGQPLASDTLFAGYFNGAASFEATGGANPGSAYNLNASMTIMAWVKMDSYESQGDSDDAYRIAGFFNRSSSTLSTATAPPYFIGCAARDGVSQAGATVRCGYFDTTGTTSHTIDWDIGTRKGKMPLDLWYHVAMTRTRNGVDDNDLNVFINGVSIGTLSTLVDANLPTSVNMRFQIGEGRNTLEGWPGCIRDVILWSSALSPADVATVYNLGTTTG